MERLVHVVGVATIAAAVACVVIPIVLFVLELIAHGPGAFPAALAILLGATFLYLWFVLPIVYLMLPLLAYARSRTPVLKAGVIVVGIAAVFAIYAAPNFSWNELTPKLSSAIMTALLVTLAAGVYFCADWFLPRPR